MRPGEFDEAIGHMTQRIDATAASVGEGFPHYANTTTGEWEASSIGDWTGGHWVGQLWLVLHQSGDERYRALARRWMNRLEQRLSSATVFRGFLFWYGAALGALLADDEDAKELGVRGARAHASAFNASAGMIPLGRGAEEATDVGDDNANVDCVAGSALLAWAAGETGDRRLYDVAGRDALRHIEMCIRDDGSVCQSGQFDPRSGEITKRYTHKGLSEDSTWARAQAWAMLGYSLCAAYIPDESAFLRTARQTAAWWIDNIPADGVAYWDFDAPQDSGTERDSSATAIAAAAFTKLSRLVRDQRQSTIYGEWAKKTVLALVRGYLTPIHAEDIRPVGMLTGGCYNQPLGIATDNELIWGDYYLLESLLALSGYLNSARI